MRNRVSKAFTLVEILIVVVILGILAAIVVPQFTNATQDSQAGNIRSQIKSVQNQIELARARSTDGQYPAIEGTTPWDFMITNGYLKAAPRNPFNGQVSVVAGVVGAAGAGWHYDRDTGTFGACYFDEEANNGAGALTPNTP